MHTICDHCCWRFLFLLSISQVLFVAAQTSADEVKWFNATDEDQQQVNDADRMVLYFNADWCTYCTKLKEEVFSVAGFHALAGKALFVAIDDKNDERSNRITLEEKLKIESYPTVVVMKRSGETFSEAGRIVGFHPVEEYLGLLRPMLGVANPTKHEVPIGIAGQGLTLDSNLCRPGDIECLIGKTKNPGLSAFDNFSDLLKPVPMVEETPAQQRQVLTDTLLVEMLKSQFEGVKTLATSATTTAYRVQIKEADGWIFPVEASLSSNQAKLWLTINLGALRSASELPADKLLQLLEFSNSYGPTTFSLVQGNLMLSRPMDNLGISKTDFTYALSELKRAARETQGVWQELRPK